MAATRAANECSDMLLVSVYRGEIAAALCSKLSSVGVLRRWLEFRRHLAAAVSAGGPDAAFVLDLSDRADVDIGLPKLASTGGCAANLPIPFALKGYGFNAWFSELGPSWRWPATAVGWAQRRAGAVWRGAKRVRRVCPRHRRRAGGRRRRRALLARPARVLRVERAARRSSARRARLRHPRAVDAELSDLDAGFATRWRAHRARSLVVARAAAARGARRAGVRRR